MITTIFDFETRKLAQEPPWDGNWGAAIADGCGGISAAALISLEINAGEISPHRVSPAVEGIRLFDDTDLEGLVDALTESDRIVSFNGLKFDIPVLEALYGSKLHFRDHVDIMALIHEALRRRTKGYRLNQVAEATLGCRKIESGAHAPAMARRGEWARLFQYCLHDTYLTKDLWLHILRCGTIVGEPGEELTVWDPLLKRC